MTGSTEIEKPDPTASTPAPPQSPEPRPARRRWWSRTWVRIVVPIVLAVVTLCVVGIMLVVAVVGRVEDDPRSLAPRGSAALVQVLRDEGVRLEITDAVQPTVAATRPGDTIVVTSPDRLGRAQWDRLLAARPADVVLLRPGSGTFWQLELPGRTVAFNGIPVATQAHCGDPDALRAETLELSYVSQVYAVDSGTTGCFPLAGGSASMTFERAGTRFHVLAGGNRNDELDKAGNASLTMAALGHNEHAVWLVAKNESTSQTSSDQGPPLLLPRGWRWGWLMAGVGFVVVCVWRGRRLGPIISERLPVRVRASETVEGHGRLYHRMGVRDRAAAALREATIRRLGRRFGQSDPLVLAGLVADQTGLPPLFVRTAFTGPPPGTDDDLVALKKTLDHIEQEVRTL